MGRDFARAALALGVLAAAAMRAPARSSEPVESAPDAIPFAALEEVFADPLPWLGREFRTVIQHRSAPANWNPYLTRFGTRDYVAAEVWADSQFLWEAHAFERPLGLVFARRGTDTAKAISDAHPYARFGARMRIDQAFLGRAWVEVLEVAPLERRVTEGTLLHAGRALQLMNGASWELALEDLRRARIPSLPRHALAELDRLRSLCADQQTEHAGRRVPVSTR